MSDFLAGFKRWKVIAGAWTFQSDYSLEELAPPGVKCKVCWDYWLCAECLGKYLDACPANCEDGRCTVCGESRPVMVDDVVYLPPLPPNGVFGDSADESAALVRFSRAARYALRHNLSVTRGGSERLWRINELRIRSDESHTIINMTLEEVSDA